MAYQMHRVFCAAPADLEQERHAFYSILGDFNETDAMQRDILFVPVSLLETHTNKAMFQMAVDANIRECRYYVQLLQNTWGPPEKNFEHDYGVALQAKDDPTLPMQEVVVMLKPVSAERPEDDRVKEFRAANSNALEFGTADEYRDRWLALLRRWLESL
jgi:hypothetical protein